MAELKGKDLLKAHDRDKNRMTQFLGQMIAEAEGCKRSIVKQQARLKVLEPEIAELKETSLSDWCKDHLDSNYTGIFKDKKGGVELSLS